MKVVFLAIFLAASVAAENFLEQPTPLTAEKNDAKALPVVKLDVKVDETKTLAASPKPAAQVEVTQVPGSAVAVPHAAVAIAVTHTQGNEPQAAAPAAAAAVTEHDHAAAAAKSAEEAKQHLEAAQAAFDKTKAHVKEIKETGKKIESTAGDIKTLYKPETPKAKEEPMEADLDLGPQPSQKDQQYSWGGRVFSQIIFGVLYWYLIVSKFPKLGSLQPNEEAIKLQKMNEVSAMMHATPANNILSWCCTGPRAAHTFHSAGIMNYWAGCVLMSCFPCLTLWIVNSFTSLNVKLGGTKRNLFMGILCSCFCSCCVVAQDAESLDLITGMETSLCGASKRKITGVSPP